MLVHSTSRGISPQLPRLAALSWLSTATRLLSDACHVEASYHPNATADVLQLSSGCLPIQQLAERRVHQRWRNFSYLKGVQSDCKLALGQGTISGSCWFGNGRPAGLNQRILWPQRAWNCLHLSTNKSFARLCSPPNSHCISQIVAAAGLASTTAFTANHQPCSTLAWSKEADEALAFLHEEPISDRLREHLRVDWPAELVEEAVLSSLNKFDGPQLVKLCWAHAVAGVRNPDYFIHLAEALYSQLSHLSITDIAHLLWAFSSLKIHHHELFAALTEFIWEALDIASCEDMRMICQAFADVDHYDDDQDLFDGIAQAAVLNVANFEPWQLCNLVWSFARLRHHHGFLFQVAMDNLLGGPGQIAREVLMNSVETLNLASLAQLVAAYGRIKCDLSTGMVNALGSRAVDLMNDQQAMAACSPRDLALLVWGFAVMGYDTRLLWDTARRVLSQLPMNGLGPEDLGRLYFAHLKVCEMRRSAPKSPYNALLPPHLLPEAFASWQISVLSLPKEYTSRTWKIHTEELMHPEKLISNVRRGLQALGVEVGPPAMSLCGNFHIKLPILTEQGGRVAVLVALPHHTTRNEPYQLLGDFQSMITELELRRWRVIPVLWYEWGQEDATDVRQRLYLARQIENTLKIRL